MDPNRDDQPPADGDRDRSRSRGRSRKRDKKEKKKKKRSGSRERRRSRSRKRSRSRRRSRSPKRRSRSRSKGKSAAQLAAEAEEERKQRLEDEERAAHRDDYTVFVNQLHPKVDEKDLFEFFSLVGRVEDIRLIRDKNQKSKGLGYVEFWKKDSRHKAVALSGQLIRGYPIMIQLCQALEKGAEAEAIDEGMRLYVGDLHPNVTQSDLLPVFEAFGKVDFVDIKTEPETGKSKCFGFVQYQKTPDAKTALAALNGLELAGRRISVRAVDGSADGGLRQNMGELDDDAGGGIAIDPQRRAMLMASLSRGQIETSIAYREPAKPVLNVLPLIQPTTCLVLKNLFNPATETDPDWHLDIKEDIEGECQKLAIPALHIHVDRQNPQGCVFLRFTTVPACQTVKAAFQGRWFSARQIEADFVPEATYIAKFPESQR